MGFTYLENNQVISELKKLLIDEHATQRQLAEALDISPQAFAKKLNKKNLSFSDVKSILELLDYDLIINFQKK